MSRTEQPEVNAVNFHLVRGSVILFDCDGVLVDSDASVDRSWTRWALEYGLDPDRVIETVHGRRTTDTVDLLIQPSDRAAALSAIDSYELEDATTATQIAGARELVASMPSSRWAVVTSGRRALARARLHAAGIDPPRVLVSADDVAAGKPDPEGYLAAAAALGVAPGDAIVIEDSGTGVEAGRRASAGNVVGVGSRALSTKADIVVRDLTSLRWDDGLRIPHACVLSRQP
jgi:sugar-phosphatase